MTKCRAAKHPDCWIECPNGNCYAYYEEETQRCIRGCNNNALPALISETISMRGLDARTSLDASALSAFTLRATASVIITAALYSAEFSNFGLQPRSSSQAASFVRGQLDVLDLAQSVRGLMFDIGWNNLRIWETLLPMKEAIISRLK